MSMQLRAGCGTCGALPTSLIELNGWSLVAFDGNKATRESKKKCQKGEGKQVSCRNYFGNYKQRLLNIMSRASARVREKFRELWKVCGDYGHASGLDNYSLVLSSVCRCLCLEQQVEALSDSDQDNYGSCDSLLDFFYSSHEHSRCVFRELNVIKVKIGSSSRRRGKTVSSRRNCFCSQTEIIRVEQRSKRNRNENFGFVIWHNATRYHPKRVMKTPN